MLGRAPAIATISSEPEPEPHAALRRCAAHAARAAGARVRRRGTGGATSSGRPRVQWMQCSRYGSTPRCCVRRSGCDDEQVLVAVIQRTAPVLRVRAEPALARGSRNALTARQSCSGCSTRGHVAGLVEQRQPRPPDQRVRFDGAALRHTSCRPCTMSTAARMAGNRERMNVSSDPNAGAYPNFITRAFTAG